MMNEEEKGDIQQILLPYEVMNAVDKPGDNAGRHEVIGIMEMKRARGRGPVCFHFQGWTLAGQEFREDIVVGIHDIETQLEKGLYWETRKFKAIVTLLPEKT